ncbi:hypothetical protein WA577_001021, partial [Blastocystis sp. JDR]
MFILLTIKDVIRIEPGDFGKEHVATLIEEINRKYSNKVIPDYGLCISFYDFNRIELGKIYPGDGASHNEVEFRMIMFRPVEGEVLVGKVLSSNRHGIRVTLEFLEDVWIPSYNLQEGSVYDPVKRVWIWHYDDGEQQLDFVVENGELIRFRVVALQYNRIEKNNTIVTSEVKNVERESDRNIRARTSSIDVQGPEISRVRSSSIDIRDERVIPPNPMSIIGDISYDGLGLIKWWIPE